MRDAQGEPTGHLIAGAADLARLRWWGQMGLPPKKWDFLYFPREQQMRALEAQGRVYLACGVVAVRDMGGSVDEVEAYVEADRLGRLPVRADLLLGLPARYLSLEEVDDALRLYFGPKQGISGARVRIGGLKIVVQNDGWYAYSHAKLRTLILEATRRGWTLAMHVTRAQATTQSNSSGHPGGGRPRATDRETWLFVGARPGVTVAGSLSAHSRSRHHDRRRPTARLVRLDALAAHARSHAPGPDREDAQHRRPMATHGP